MYTQHQPQLGQILEQLLKMRLKEASYPFVESGAGGYISRDRPQDIIVFMVGGATFEEARYIAMLNAATPGVRIILGGTSVHNSQRYDDILLFASIFLDPRLTPCAFLIASSTSWCIHSEP